MTEQRQNNEKSAIWIYLNRADGRSRNHLVAIIGILVAIAIPQYTTHAAQQTRQRGIRCLFMEDRSLDVYPGRGEYRYLRSTGHPGSTKRYQRRCH